MCNTDIFVCEAPYHIYLPLLKAYENKQNNMYMKNVIILSDIISDNSALAQRLKKISFIDEVLYVRYKSLSEQYIFKNHEYQFIKIFNLIMLHHNLIKVFDKKLYFYKKYKLLFQNARVNLFWGYHPLSRYIMIKHNNIKFIEEGNGIYSANFKYRKLKKIIRHYLGLPDIHGGDSNVREIEITYPNKINSELRHKTTKLDIKSLQKKLDTNARYEIAGLYFNNSYWLNIIKECVERIAILITQPLSEDKVMPEERKIMIYKNCIRHLKYHKYHILIKSHPREKTNYQKIFNDDSITILPQNFPLEVLNILILSNLDVGITVNSTALDNLTCVERKIYLKHNITMS